VLAGRVIQPASLPSSPVSPNHPVAGALGIIAGLALATGLAFARERLSGRLRSAEETEEYLGAPMLGSIPQISEWRRRKDSLLVTLGPRRSPAAEAYRMLRTNVLSAASAQGAKSIVVTSALAGEGKSSTVGNLGVVLARAGRHVSLVSADLRRPRLHQFFRCDGLVGLADVLAGRMSLDQVTQEINLPESSGSQLPAVHLRILPTGPVPENPAELLTSETMGKVLADLEASSDIVLIDAPPILAVTDALVVAQLAQAVLVVVGPRSLDRSLVASARQQLDKVGGRILGGVLNGPDRSMTAYGNYASYY
jgi:capsular exopolysaccharide synthesis family protein